MLFDSCISLFEDVFTEVCCVPRIVHEMIARHISEEVSVDLPTEEEIRTILEDIENFEATSGDVNIGDDDDDDDNDDDSDDEVIENFV